MAEHKVQPSSMLLIIQNIVSGQTINNTVVCLKSITKNNSVNVIDANSWCGQKKLAGISDISYNFECIHLQDPQGDKLSGTNLRVLAYQKLLIYYKIIPEIPQTGDEFEEGYGFISDISSNYSFDNVGTFSMTITAKGTPTLYNSDDFVRIGNQMWSNKNLEVTQFRNGVPIVEATDNTNWFDLIETETPAWAYWEYDSNNASLGKYYNTFAINSINNLAPIGTRIPNYSDAYELYTKILSDYPTTSGFALRESGTQHWYNDQGFDAYGFSLQGNGVAIQGDLNFVGAFGFKVDDGSNANIFCQDDYNDVLFSPESPFNYLGLNIRLLLDI
jgi:uncharacterized protein (TIGR02145 family)